MLARLCLIVMLLGACGEDPEDLGPKAALNAFLMAMEQSTHAPEQRKVAYGFIDQKSQAHLSERAELTASLAGRKFEPWELLVPGRMSFAGLGRGGVQMSVKVEGDKATVSIPVEGRAPAEVPMVRENGRWHVVLGLSPTGDKN